MSARSKQVAEQLRGLMDRHGIVDAPSFGRLLASQGRTIDKVTVHRILKAEARTEPEENTLRELAAACGEDSDEVFPSRPQMVIAVGGRRVAVRALDGKEFSPAFKAELMRAVGPALAMEGANLSEEGEALVGALQQSAAKQSPAVGSGQTSGRKRGRATRKRSA